MTTPFAIAPSPSRFGKPVHTTCGDAMRDRPPIPRTVIEWPIGAGDPAADVAGPDRFRVVEARRKRGRSTAIEALAVGALFVAFLSFAGLRLGVAPEVVVVRTPHVDARIVGIRAAPDAAPKAVQAQRAGPPPQRSARG